MKLEAVRTIARSHSIKPGNISKTALIRMIQAAEGNFACYATAYSGECDQVSCCWREDCFDASAK